MIALIILAVFLGVVLFLFFFPINVFLCFEEDFTVLISFAGIKLFSTEKKSNIPKKEKTEKKSTPASKENTFLKDSKRLFSFLREKYGFGGAVRTVLEFLNKLLSHTKTLLRHIKIKKVRLNITVADFDAAKTAIEYGAVCSAAYPVLAFLNSFAKVGFKKVDIRSDFEGNTPEFNFSADIKLQMFFLLVVAYRVYSEYKKFLLKENFNGRE